MWFRTLFDSMKLRRSNTPTRQTPRRPTGSRLLIEALEDRCLPSTFTVINLLDSGAGSLRAAVAAANANPGPDEIDFAVTGAIPLTSGQLDITESLTINGPGESALTVSGEGVSRVFAIAGTPTVLIANLTVANGLTTDSPGGGIAMAGGAVTLDHVTVSGNSAVGRPGGHDPLYGDYPARDGMGGGLYVTSGTLTLHQSTVSGNYAIGGQGWGGPGTGVQSGTSGERGAGGGLYVAEGTVYVNQSTVSGNWAFGGRGGDADWQYWVYLDNTWGGIGGHAIGGGLCVAGGRLEVRGSTVSGNTAVGGDGGYGDTYGWPGVGAGGGMFLGSAAPPRADLDTFTESHTVNNYADIDPNISGPYSLNGQPPPPDLAVADASVVEGHTGTTALVFQVTLSAASSQPVTVGWATANGTATADSDYQSASGTLTIPAGQTSGTITVSVNGDRLAEANETLAVNLSAPTNATIADGTGVGTIVDDEPRIYIGDATRTEGNTGTTLFAFTVSLSPANLGAPIDGPVTVDFATADGSATAADNDYQETYGTLTIPAGQTTGTITVPVNSDRLAEANEAFTLNLSNPVNAGIADSQGVGAIVDDEPRVNIYDVAKNEGNTDTTPFAFAVRLWAAYDVPVTVNFATANGSATEGTDYQATSGTLTIPAGQTTGTITVLVNGDRLVEPNETFFVTPSNLNYGVIASSWATGTILDDEPRVSITDVTKSEGRKNKTTLFTFMVTLSAAYDQAVTMSYRTVNGTATTSDNDYVARTGTLTFAPGETTKTITIEVKGDSKKEAYETFYLDLFGLSSNALFTKTRGVGMIVNDD
jgi:hypothetical protein